MYTLAASQWPVTYVLSIPSYCYCVKDQSLQPNHSKIVIRLVVGHQRKQTNSDNTTHKHTYLNVNVQQENFRVSSSEVHKHRKKGKQIITVLHLQYEKVATCTNCTKKKPGHYQHQKVNRITGSGTQYNGTYNTNKANNASLVCPIHPVDNCFAQ